VRDANFFRSSADPQTVELGRPPDDPGRGIADGIHSAGCFPLLIGLALSPATSSFSDVENLLAERGVAYVGEQRTRAGAVPGSHNLASTYSIEGQVVPEELLPLSPEKSSINLRIASPAVGGSTKAVGGRSEWTAPNFSRSTAMTVPPSFARV
jgi:hypothetical protein